MLACFFFPSFSLSLSIHHLDTPLSGLLQMQLILHYDETYREVKYGNLGLEDIDKKMLMGINVTPIVALLYTPVLIRFLGTKWMMFLAIGIYALFVSTNYWERYYTLVPSAVAIGVAIVPLWAALGNYITRSVSMVTHS
ncbi:protein unc-93 homolog B1-like [Chiloscyllium plagiosum]|uniref:protein unc-93 homolog B1-like n=1 Tax=Chiloscyllium plagiosum TaxID=36176 RepID=UPI001CB82EFB|nr:protein unc-93 homolog B1-like [Chiloscyllium plagiosum]